MKDLTVQELIEAALSDTDENTKIINDLNDVQKFVLANEIKSGKKKISATAVYSTYLKWRKEHPLPKRTFFFFFSQYFERIRKNQGVFYLLDGEAFDVDIDKYWPLRAQVRAEHEKARKSNERKK